jgi:hypothetical protein
MPNTFTLISAVTVGAGGAATIEFTSIPSTYTDLQVVYSVRESQTAAMLDLNFYFNNSTSGYSEKMLYGSASAGSGSASTSGGLFNWGVGTGSNATANTFASGQFYIPNYAGSNNKSLGGDYVGETNATAANFNAHSGLWSNSAAITSIQIKPQSSSGTLVQYSTAYLYGIKNS